MEHGTQAEEGSGPDVIDTRVLTTIERWVLFSALLLSVIAGVLWQAPFAVGSAAAGGLIAVLNFWVLKRTVRGIIWGSVGTKTALSVVLFLKMGLLLVSVWAAVRVLGFDPVGVALGVSSLVVGIVGGTLASQQQLEERALPER